MRSTPDRARSPMSKTLAPIRQLLRPHIGAITETTTRIEGQQAAGSGDSLKAETRAGLKMRAIGT